MDVGRKEERETPEINIAHRGSFEKWINEVSKVIRISIQAADLSKEETFIV